MESNTTVPPEGRRFRPSSSSLAVGTYFVLFAFAWLQILVTPKIGELFDQMRVPIPGLTRTYLESSEWMAKGWPAVALGLIVLALWFAAGGFARMSRKFIIPVTALVVINLVVYAVAMGVPLMALFQGIG